MRKFLYHIFREADTGDNAGTNKPDTSKPDSSQLTTEQIASIVAAVEARQQRAGNAAAKAIAEQYGMSAEEMTALLKTEQKKQADKIPEAAQKQIDEANAKLQAYQLTAEVTKLGNAMGLVDADVAMTLLDRTKLSYKDGKYDGVQAALDALKESKPYLFKTKTEEKGGAWGQQRKGGAPGNETTARDEMRKMMFGK